MRTADAVGAADAADRRIFDCILAGGANVQPVLEGLQCRQADFETRVGDALTAMATSIQQLAVTTAKRSSSGSSNSSSWP